MQLIGLQVSVSHGGIVQWSTLWTVLCTLPELLMRSHGSLSCL